MEIERERKVVTTVITWRFDGADGMHNEYLAVHGLVIKQVSEKTGELYFWVREVDDGQNIPHERSMETIRGMVRDLEKQVKNGTFLSLEKSPVIDNDPFKLAFKIPDGTSFIDHAVTLSFLVFQIFNLQIKGHNFDQVRITRKAYIPESPHLQFF